MKTLLKISFVLAFALFVSMSVKASDPEASGTITTTVVPFLDFDTFIADVNLIWDEFGNTDVPSITTAVKIKGNVDWTLSLLAVDDILTDPSTLKTLPLSNIAVENMSGTALSTTTAITADGVKDIKQHDVTFKLADLGNAYAGSYQAAILYTLAEQ